MLRGPLLVVVSLTLLLGNALSEAQGKRRPGPASTSYQSNVADERAPTPPLDETSYRSAGSGERSPAPAEFSAVLQDLLLEWQQALRQHMPEELVWGVLASPALVLLMLWWLLRRHRRGGQPQGAAAKKPGKPARARTSARSKSRWGARKRKESRDKGTTDPTLSGVKELAGPVPTLDDSHKVLLLRGGAGEPSFYDMFVGIGPDFEAFTALRKVLRAGLDESHWAGVVRDQQVGELHPVGQEWCREVATTRLANWLSAHPLVLDSGLKVQVPGSLVSSEIEGLTLTAADGLGMDLSKEQEEILVLPRRALAQVFDGALDPCLLMSVAHHAPFPALVSKEISSDPDHRPRSYALFLLLGGQWAMSRVGESRLSHADLGEEFCAAIEEHVKLVGTPVPAEGCAVHALELLEGGNLEGVGTLMAAVAGAAFSTSAVVLRISMKTGAVQSTQLQGALPRLGALIARCLDDEDTADGQNFKANIQWTLGIDLLAQELERLNAASKQIERSLTKDPLWHTKGEGPRSPDAVLWELHHIRVIETLAAAKTAQARLMVILGQLAASGSSGEDQRKSHARLGYAVASLGMPLLRSTSTELLSAGREVVSALE